MDLLIDGTRTLWAEGASSASHRGCIAMNTLIPAARFGRVPSRQTWGECGRDHGGMERGKVVSGNSQEFWTFPTRPSRSFCTPPPLPLRVPLCKLQLRFSLLMNPTPDGESIPLPGHWPVDPQEDVPISDDRIWVDGCFDFSHHGELPHLSPHRRSLLTSNCFEAMPVPCCRLADSARNFTWVSIPTRQFWNTRVRR